MPGLSTSRLRFALLAIAASLAIMMAACTTDEDETATPTSTMNITPTATSSSAEGSPTAGTSPTSQASPSASTSPTREASPSARTSPTSEASPPASASPAGTATGGTGAVDCSAIGNLGVPGTTLDTQGSEQPTSQFAGEISSFFEGVLDNALSDATPTCFLEVGQADNTALWISFKLEDPASPDAADLVSAELIAEGVADEDVEAVSGNVFGREFSGVTVTNHPALGQYRDTGVGLFITMDAAVLVAGTGGPAGSPQ